MTKVCNRCNVEKELEAFAKGSKYVDGRRNYCKQCHSSYVVNYVKENPEKRSKDHPHRKFKRHGLTPDVYYSLLNQYSGKCHSCKQRDGNNIDHDHACCPGSYSCGNCVRGLLCNQCNTALGLLGDDLQKINSLIGYISR
jgi:hypothetical protein